LLSHYQSIGPTFIAAEGHNVGGLGEALEPETPVLGNTCWAAPLLYALNVQGPSVLLIHEMVDYLAQQDLLGVVAKAPMVIAAFPTVTDGLMQRLPATTPVKTVMPGLLHSTKSASGTARISTTINDTFGSDRIIVIGAGFADHRKGFDRFLDTARRMFELEPRCAFIWLGELGAWGQERAAESSARGLPLLLPGFRADASAWYSNAHVYLLTSRQDPGPTTTIDAARCGVPFIAAPGDLGIKSLGSRLAGVGWFTDHEADLPQRALDIVGTQTPQSRAQRAEYIESLASFGRYTSDLLDVLRQLGLVDEPLLRC
jgi:glycosyltransferase involved in cell wall biosynthesis